VLALNFLCGVVGIAAAQWFASSGRPRLLAGANAFTAGVLLSCGMVCMLPDAAPLLSKGHASAWAAIAVITLISVEEIAMIVAQASEDNSKREGEAGPATPRQRGLSSILPSNSWRLRSALFTLCTGWGKRCSARCSADDVYSALPSGDCQDCTKCSQGCPLLAVEAGQVGGVLGPASTSTTKAFCLFAALSFHSAMEGLGLGTARTASLLTSASTAILAHKGLGAFALGSALRQSRMGLGRIVVLGGIFALGTPAGIALGMFAASNLDGPGTAVCTALAAGTFMQVAMMEIIPAALQSSPGDSALERASRCILLALGFCTMSRLIFMIG